MEQVLLQEACEVYDEKSAEYRPEWIRFLIIDHFLYLCWRETKLLTTRSFYPQQAIPGRLKDTSTHFSTR
ncbi:hypothetical protein Plhal304r1_c086g0169501 [Plasmopara halstedii]